MLCLAITAAAGAFGFWAATVKASRAQLPLEELQKRFAATIAQERESDRRHYAAAFEEMVSLADTVKRHAAKVDGQRGGRPKGEPEEPPRQLTKDEMRQQVLQLARRRGA